MNSRKLDGVVLPVLGKAEVCEACGAEFACGASLAGCWCAEVELSEAVRAQLRTRYRRCLCRVCLERFAAGGSGSEGGETSD